MKKIFIVFTHKNNWKITGIVSNEAGDNPGETIQKGFTETSNHFATITFEENTIKGQYFGYDSFPNINGNCVLLIHNDEKVSRWDDEKKEAATTFIKAFNEVFIYYHHRDKNEHEPIEKLIKGAKVTINKDEAMHEKGFLFGKLDDLADIKTEEAFNNKLKEFENAFFDSEEATNEKNVLNKKLTFLHKLLGNDYSEEELESYEKEYDFEYNANEHIESIRKIRDILLDKVV